MSDIPKKANGLHVIVDEIVPMARIYMFIGGAYTHWVEFDLPQMNGMIEVMQRKVKEMEQNRDSLK